MSSNSPVEAPTSEEPTTGAWWGGGPSGSRGSNLLLCAGFSKLTPTPHLVCNQVWFWFEFWSKLFVAVYSHFTSSRNVKCNFTACLISVFPFYGAEGFRIRYPFKIAGLISAVGKLKCQGGDGYGDLLGAGLSSVDLTGRLSTRGQERYLSGSLYMKLGKCIPIP